MVPSTRVRIIGSVPFSQTLDTSQATTDADEAQLNALCGAPRTDASVWYQVTATASGGMVVDVSRSGSAPVPSS